MPEMRGFGGPAPLNQKGPRGTIKLVAQIIAAVVLLAVFALPTFLVLLMGMTPTLVAIMTDDRPDRYRIQVVGGFNLSGVIVFLVPLWTTGHGVEQATALLSDVYTWAVMYLAAGFGVAALWIGPQIAAAMTGFTSMRRARRFDDVRVALIEEWGRDVIPEGEMPPVGMRLPSDRTGQSDRSNKPERPSDPKPD